MSKASEKVAERENALARLREMVKPGDTLYTVLRHVSRSGMSRSISCIVHTPEGPVDMSWAVARALGWSFDRRNDGVKVSGCGMDMGFHLVYSLSYTLFKNGAGDRPGQGFVCIGEGCPANDHNNPPYPLAVAGSMTHSDAVYALRQRWL